MNVNKIKIAHVLHSVGGVDVYLRLITENLDSDKFEIIVFTASHSCYANVVLDTLDPDKKYIQHRLFR